MKEGAHDFITKPIDAQHLRYRGAQSPGAGGVEAGFGSALGRNRQPLSVDHRHEPKNERSRRNREEGGVRRKATVLLLGESGTGKEVFARAIHNWSERKDQPFVAINCVGLSKELLESELFGHEKGAFTGADQQKKGKMELANGGTVFLDEIGDVSQELQTKLLRFLQEREFDRVGGVRPIKVDVRIIAATNRDLESAIKEGRFREDLYHRLNVVPITLAPLRERAEDIPGLGAVFHGPLRQKGQKSTTRRLQVTPCGGFCSYDWPGNVRELGNVIERAVVLGNGPLLGIKDLPSRIVATAVRPSLDGRSYRDAMEYYRRELVLAALERSHGNRAAAARALGLHEKYLFRLLKSLGIGG